jgi:predicted O-methyltransferase YrrM
LSAIARTAVQDARLLPSIKEGGRFTGVKFRTEKFDSPTATWYDAFGDQLAVELVGLDARLTDSEKRWMWEAAQSLPENALYCEVGTDRGGSANVVLLAHPTVRVFTIDPMNGDPKRRSFLKSRFSSFKGRIHLVPYVSVDEDRRALASIRKALKGMEPEFDMLFLDGAHTDEDISQEIDLYLPLVKPGGLICGHDYHRNFSVRKRYSGAVDREVAKHGLQLRIFDRIWYAGVPL